MSKVKTFFQDHKTLYKNRTPHLIRQWIDCEFKKNIVRKAGKKGNYQKQTEKQTSRTLNIQRIMMLLDYNSPQSTYVPQATEEFSVKNAGFIILIAPLVT